jgi:mono/diheme cytochrome c family protein
VTEVPEHLLRRARERRAALTGGDAGGGEPAAAGEEAATPAEEGGAAAPARAAAPAAAPTAAAPAPVVTQEPEPEVPAVYVAAARASRSRVPTWVVPVLAVLPVWGFLYLGAFGNRGKTQVVDPLVLGSQVYRSAGCSGCHGASGEGGVGPALQNGGAKLTFPNEEDQLSWVRTGSGPFTGKPYGDPNRPGGQRGPAKGVMPGFGSTLSDAQIRAVVKYEREKL